jgi:DNA-directed RNA polymerase subunit M/transcription elongation factor TFIIS
MKECQNCGRPMIKKEDFGNEDFKNSLCRYCFFDKNNNGREDFRKKESKSDSDSSAINNIIGDDYL